MTTTAIRRLLWDWTDENHPEVWDGEVSDDVVDEAVGFVASAALGMGAKRRSMFNWSKDVRSWLEHPERFSPYIDEVAITRSLDFDWPVIENLTNQERSVFYDYLAAMEDPFEDEDWTASMWRRLVNAGQDPSPHKTTRRLRFEDGTVSQRWRLRLVVNRHRVSRTMAGEPAGAAA
jgi:hypothetical protein